MTNKPPAAKLNQPTHRHIYQQLSDAILSGKYLPGQKLPTDGMLVRRYSVSRPTVARAMRDLELEGLVERRRGSGTYVLASALEKSIQIGLLIPNLGKTEIFEPICAEIARLCTKQNFSLLWGDASCSQLGWDVTTLEKQCQYYIQQKVSGVFFAPLELISGSNDVNQKIAQDMKQAGIAVVLLDRDIEVFPKRSEFDLVGVDNYRAGFTQASHLIAQGCRKLLYVAQKNSAPTVSMRIAGFQFAVSKNQNCSGREIIDDLEDLNLLSRLLNSEPDGIICANDASAMIILKALNTANIKVPMDLKIIGMDDCRYARYLTPSLSTLKQPCQELGARAMQAMIKRIEDFQRLPCDYFLEASFVERESTKL